VENKKIGCRKNSKGVKKEITRIIKKETMK
jgi:hypothetical protein